MSSKILISMVVLCLMVLQYSLVSGYRFPRSDEEESSESDSSNEDEQGADEVTEVIGCDPLQEMSLVNGLANGDITASSTFGSNAPFRARFNTAGYWEPSTYDGVYIQFKLAVPRTITKIITIGDIRRAHVKLYAVAYSTDADCSSFMRIPQNFTGNVDGFSNATNMFTNPFTAQCVQVLPFEDELFPALQVDLFGC